MTPHSLVVCFGILATPVGAGASDTIMSRNVSVIDGNRLTLDGAEIRLAGIIAPPLGRRCMLFEKTRDCGLIARASLLDLTAGAKVSCRIAGTVGGTPSYRCTADGYDLSEGMVYTGWAVPLDGAPKAYWRVLADARARPRGFWRGRFVAPWAPLRRIVQSP